MDKRRAFLDVKKRGGDDMVKDPVCGMDVDPPKAAAQSQHNGETYYFCSQGCKQKFDQNPGQFEDK